MRAKALIVSLFLLASAQAAAQTVIRNNEILESDRPEAWSMNYFAASSLLTSTGEAPPAGDAAGGPTAPIDLNTATLAELDTLPGVGPVLAQRILDWRTEHGQFATVDQLSDVPGIGDARLAQLRDLVQV